VALLVLSLAWLLAWGAALWLERSAPISHADALIVFSGSSTYVERNRFAASLYHDGKAPLIILTNDSLQGGWSNELNRNPFFFERAVKELLAGNVPNRSIEVLPDPICNTYDEALLLKKHAVARGYTSLLFVTSAYHGRRALFTLRRVFQGTGINVGLEIVAPGDQSPRETLWWSTVRGWRQVGLEYPKLIYYYIHYR
jgi:uncharacterized SAM-binding protein YcdF (DUF218 family)